MDKISRQEELERKKQRLRKASVIDEITIDIPIEEEEKKKKKNEKFEKRNEYHHVSKDDEKDINDDLFEEEIVEEPKKNKKKKKKNNTFLKILLVIIISVIGYFGYRFIRGMNQNGWTIGGFVATMLGHDSNTLARLSRTNILLIGQSQNLTDTIMLVGLDVVWATSSSFFDIFSLYPNKSTYKY